MYVWIYELFQFDENAWNQFILLWLFSQIRKVREEENKASEEFIRRLMEEEKIVDTQMQQMIENDEELAKRLQQQIQSPAQPAQVILFQFYLIKQTNQTD